MAMVARSDAEVLNRLQHLFQQFNAQFFGGALAAYEIQVDLLIAGLTIVKLRSGKYRQLPGSGHCLFGLSLPEEQIILIDTGCAKMENPGVREVLLHEMCHAEVYRTLPMLRGDPRGQEFVAELCRLAALGERWAGEHAEYYQTVPSEQQTKYPLDAWRCARSG